MNETSFQTTASYLRLIALACAALAVLGAVVLAVGYKPLTPFDVVVVTALTLAACGLAIGARSWRRRGAALMAAQASAPVSKGDASPAFDEGADPGGAAHRACAKSDVMRRR